MAISFEYSRGETIKIGLGIEDNDPDVVVTSVQAHLRPAARGTRVVDPLAPLAAVFEVIPAENGWHFVLPPEVSAALAPGRYLTDALLTLDSGDVIITDALPINIVTAATVQ
jgi:hypothetical protein